MPLTNKQIVGKIGENAVVEYLKKRGFSILDCNYLQKWGELDIVAWKNDRIHFVEVKSLSREIGDLSETLHVKESYRPEDNVHPRKLQRLAKTIQTYLLEKKVPDTVEWQFDVATVLVDQKKKLCRVTILGDIII